MISNKMIYKEICALVVLFLVFLGCNLGFENGQLDVFSIVLWLASAIVVIWSFNKVLKEGIKSYNLFGISYFAFLHLNTYKLSGEQTAITFLDCYYWLLGALTLLIILFYAERIKIKKIFEFRSKIDINKVVLASIFLYVAIYIYIFGRVGIKLFSGDYGNTNFTLSGFTGIAGMLDTFLLICIPHVKKKYKIIIVAVVVLLSGVLGFNRHNCVLPILFCILNYAYQKKSELFFKADKTVNKKDRRKIVLLIVSFVVIFALLGNVRQILRWSGSDSSDVTAILNRGMNVDIKDLIWIYGYSVVNFDVLKLYYDVEPIYEFETVMIPINRITQGGQYYEEFLNRNYSQTRAYGINGFNACTFLVNYISDMGYFYWIELIAFGLIVSLFMRYAKLNKFDGLYVYIMMLMVMNVFGDYFMVPSTTYGLILSAMLLKISTKGDVV